MSDRIKKLEKARALLLEKAEKQKVDLKKKDKSIRQQIARINSAESERQRKGLTREKILIGAITLARMQKNPGLVQEYQQAISAIPEAQRRGLFEAGWQKRHAKK